MNNSALEKLFAVGYVNDTVEFFGVKFGITVLDTRRLTDALNAAVGKDEQAQLLSYKSEILARAIISINGKMNFEDVNFPTQDEIDKILNGVLAKLHYTLINALYEKYDELDKSVAKEVTDDVKKSLSNRGA